MAYEHGEPHLLELAAPGLIAALGWSTADASGEIDTACLAS